MKGSCTKRSLVRAHASYHALNCRDRQRVKPNYISNSFSRAKNIYYNFGFDFMSSRGNLFVHLKLTLQQQAVCRLSLIIQFFISALYSLHVGL